MSIKSDSLLLQSLLKEISVTGNTKPIGYLWPFSETDELASSWENTRLANLYQGSLKGYFTYDGTLDSITNNSDIETTSGIRGGTGNDKVFVHPTHKTINKLYKDSEVERHIHHHHHQDDEKKYTIKIMPAGETPNKKKR